MDLMKNHFEIQYRKRVFSVCLFGLHAPAISNGYIAFRFATISFSGTLTFSISEFVSYNYVKAKIF